MYLNMASEATNGQHFRFQGQDGLRKYQKSFCYTFEARDDIEWHFIWLFVPSVLRGATFLVFNMAAILDSHLEFES